jgi:hypothetical protein
MPRKENIEAVLNKFGKYVVQQARSNLSKKSKNVSKELYNSISYDLNVSQAGRSFSMVFKMADYGEFQDKGVKGAGGTRKTTSAFNRRNNKGKIWKQKAPNSPFQFKNKKPPISAFKRWAEEKGLNPYAVRESVFRQGIPATKFFSTPFRLGFNKLPPDIVKAFELTQEDLQAFTRK